MASPDPCACVLNFLYSPEIGNTVEIPEEHEESRKGRKRVRDPENWKHKHLKKPGLRKNAPHLEISTLSGCCKECLKAFSVSHLTKIPNDFEALYYEQQNIYLNGLLHRRETKKTSGHKRISTPTLTPKGKRLGRPPAEESKFSFTYSIHNEKGIDAKVCQKAFCCVHGFSLKRLHVLRDKIMSAGEDAIVWDKRGKHGNHREISDDVRELIRDHILSFPARSSRYSRSDNSERVYLSPELSIGRLYRDFLQKHDPEYVRLEQENREQVILHKPQQPLRKPIASSHFYHDIFVTEFNIFWVS